MNFWLWCQPSSDIWEHIYSIKWNRSQMGIFFLFQEHAHFRTWPTFIFFNVYLFGSRHMCHRVHVSAYVSLQGVCSLYYVGPEKWSSHLKASVLTCWAIFLAQIEIFYCNFKGNIIFSLIYTFSWLLSVAQRIWRSQGSCLSFYLK